MDFEIHTPPVIVFYLLIDKLIGVFGILADSHRPKDYIKDHHENHHQDLAQCVDISACPQSLKQRIQ